jgi:hypothetical protein
VRLEPAASESKYRNIGDEATKEEARGIIVPVTMPFPDKK